MWTVRWHLGILGLTHLGYGIGYQWPSGMMRTVLGIWDGVLGTEHSAFLTGALCFSGVKSSFWISLCSSSTEGTGLREAESSCRTSWPLLLKVTSFLAWVSKLASPVCPGKLTLVVLVVLGELICCVLARSQYHTCRCMLLVTTRLCTVLAKEQGCSALQKLTLLPSFCPRGRLDVHTFPCVFLHQCVVPHPRLPCFPHALNPVRGSASDGQNTTHRVRSGVRCGAGVTPSLWHCHLR